MKKILLLLFTYFFLCPVQIFSDVSGSLKSAGRAEANALSKLGEKIFFTGRHDFDIVPCKVKNITNKEITVTQPLGRGFAGETTTKIKPGDTQQLKTPFWVDGSKRLIPNCPHGVAVVSDNGVSF